MKDRYGWEERKGGMGEREERKLRKKERKTGRDV